MRPNARGIRYSWYARSLRQREPLSLKEKTIVAARVMSATPSAGRFVVHEIDIRDRRATLFEFLLSSSHSLRITHSDRRIDAGVCARFTLNLWLRLLLTCVISWRRSRIHATEQCSTPFIVMLSDLDALGHVNNGKYFSLMDVARVDHALRTRYVVIFRRRAWWPVVVASTIQFYRSLLPFRRFVIETQLIGWDEDTFFVHHRVVLNDASRKLVAEAIVRAVIRNSAGSIATRDVVTALGEIVPPGPMPDWVASWARSLDQVRIKHKCKAA